MLLFRQHGVFCCCSVWGKVSDLIAALEISPAEVIKIISNIRFDV